MFILMKSLGGVNSVAELRDATQIILLQARDHDCAVAILEESAVF